MKTPKQQTIELLDKLPDDISFETILAEIAFKMQVLERSAQVDRGEVVSHEEAKRRLSRWLHSSGR
jgi:hypothetical protein